MSNSSSLRRLIPVVVITVPPERPLHRRSEHGGRPRETHRLRVLLTSAVLAVCTAVSATAQDPARGRISGTVLSEGQPLAEATVTLEQRQISLQRAITDSTGAFSFVGLLPGVYDLTVQRVGYNAARARNLRVAAGLTENHVLTLTPAIVQLAPLEIAAGRALRIERESTEMSTVVREEAIRLLPTRHDALELVALTPGARAGHIWGGATQQANNYQLDGVSANHPGIGGGLVEPSVNWIERVEVRGLGAGAEHGNFQGGLVNIVTKSGGNTFQGAFRTNFENHLLNSSNFIRTEIASEVASRNDLEAEVRGPIVRNRLFYYLAGQVTQRETRFLNHLPFVDGRFAAARESARELKLFGKLSWRPSEVDFLEASFARFENEMDHAGLSGYEHPSAALRRTAPASLLNVSWRRDWSRWISLEAKAAGFSFDESRTPYGDDGLPGIQYFGILPPFGTYQNAPLRFRSHPESLTTGASATVRFGPGATRHQIRLGVEHTLGSFLDQRLRNGGMTWRPPRLRTVDVEDPRTWAYSALDLIPLTTGGEVHLDASVQNSAAFLQGSFSVGNRLVVNPGLRQGWWTGRLNPVGGTPFVAIRTSALDPRLGVVADLDGEGSFLLKAHWGRFHQSMIAQFFDRAVGGNVFTNEQLWYYYGEAPATPTAAFGPDAWARLESDGLLRLVSEVRLNETGPLADYSQPYIDQWIVGGEKLIAGMIKFDAVYVDRRNRNMVALLDLHRETNYTRYENVRVLNAGGQPLDMGDAAVFLHAILVPNNVLIDRLKCLAADECTDALMPPGMTFADTLRLSWREPEYVLTNAPDARREFQQLQLSLEVARPRWGASASHVWTRLRGNLDTVTGYDDPAGYGPGPYVRVNEGLNAFGRLPNHSPGESKVAVWGNFPYRFNGGMYWTRVRGEHYAPVFTVRSTGGYRYRVGPTGRNPEELDAAFLLPLEGHNLFVGQRGRPALKSRVMLDLRLEREFPVRRSSWSIAVDVFNVLNFDSVTRLNTSVNRGRNFYYFLGPEREGTFRVIDPNEYYRAPLERVPPRTVRVGTSVRF